MPRLGRNDLRNLERRAKVLQLRRQGKNYKEIGQALGISTTRAYQLVWDEMDRLSAHMEEDVSAIRTEAESRLRRLINAIWERALGGDLQAIDQVAKLQDRLNKLYGVDAPAKQEVTTKVEKLSPEELKAEARKLGIYPDHLFKTDPQADRLAGGAGTG